MIENFFSKNNLNKLKEYQLPQGWNIQFPHSWNHEYNKEDDQNIFYPDNDDLTIRITAFQVRNKDGDAALEVLRAAFLNSSQNFSLKDTNIFKTNDYIMECVEKTFMNDNKTIYHVSCGLAVEGHLLTVNIFGSNQLTVDQSLQYVNTVKRI